MLTDVIKASKLTETRKETIINKLYSTIGIYKNADNTDNIIFLDSKKHGNSSIIYNIDAIETAIQRRIKDKRTIRRFGNVCTGVFHIRFANKPYRGELLHTDGQPLTLGR